MKKRGAKIRNEQDRARRSSELLQQKHERLRKRRERGHKARRLATREQEKDETFSHSILNVLTLP